MELEKAIKTPKLDESAMDLSTLKEFWVIIHFKECDPGNEYEILNDACIEGDSWDTLARDVNICVKFGNARVQGQVVVISDDLLYLQANFKSLTEEYNLEHYGDTNYFKKPSVPAINYFPEYPVISKHIIKVCDRETQTDEPAVENLSSEEDYQNLKLKYDRLQSILKSLTDNISSATQEAKAEVENLLLNSRSSANRSCKIKIRELQEKEPLETCLGSQENIDANSFKHNNRNIHMTDNEVFIGGNKTQILRSVFENINWHNYSGATRKLLMTVFPRSVLATHTLTGKPNPAFRKNNISTKKMRLDPQKIADIIEIVTMKCHVSESLVRSAITTKCADENKMLKIRMERKGNGDMENTEPRVDFKKNVTSFSNKRLKL